MHHRFLLPVVASSFFLACGESAAIDASIDDAGMNDAGTRDAGMPDAGTRDSGMRDAGSGCVRAPRAADRVRYAVVSHPYDAAGEQSAAFEVLELATDGTLSQTGTTFELSRAWQGTIAFTPDGEVGLVAHEDGTLGVFTLADDGTPTVVHAAYSGAFYAGSVVMDPAGDAAWILDSQWRESGGGVYRVEIGCDGSLSGEALVAPARLPYGMAFRDDGTAVLAARDVLDTSLGPDVHLVDLATPDVVASGDVFADDEWIVAGFAISAGGDHAFLGDNAAFSATGMRLGVAALDATSVTGVQEIPDILDPVAIVASPFDDAVLVVSGSPPGEGLYAFDYDPSAAMPLTLRGEIAYVGAAPALPGASVQIERGTLTGLVLVAENLGVRRARFADGGAITDLGAFPLGTGLAAITGALGVQP